ncbi:MAG: virulence protein SciE type [Phycisphaerae bacterium SM23_30]|nr:MAG: virulence protein SciE type [Phycisphaerae bacterium SM23_30]
MQAEELLQAGRLREALEKLQEQVRTEPANAKYRVFLFQLLSVLGEWNRALTQLKVAADLDAQNLLMAQVCRAALNCEALRTEIFAGSRLPMVFGEPAAWIGQLMQANQMVGQQQYQAAQPLREQAFEAAPAIAGEIDGASFEWIADADPRLGPVLEALIDQRYYWVPFTCIRQVDIEPPADLRDLVWIPVQFTWTNEGQSMGLIPTRYPGSETSEDDAVKLARKTEWKEYPGGLWLGLGQRCLATDAGEYPILETRQIKLNQEGPAPAEKGD